MSFRHDLTGVRVTLTGREPLELRTTVDALDPRQPIKPTGKGPDQAHVAMLKSGLPCTLSWIERGVRVADVLGYLTPEAGQIVRIYTRQPGVFYRVQVQPEDMAQVRTRSMERRTPREDDKR